MRAVVWISESSWEACVDRAREALPPETDITLLHVAAADAEHLVDHPGPGWLGRHRPPPPGPTAHEIGEAEAAALLLSAKERLGRPARTDARRGRVEHEVIQALHQANADLLVLVRDGESRPGPKSLGKRARFVVDHAGCEVLLAWPERPRQVRPSAPPPEPPAPAPRSPPRAS